MRQAVCRLGSLGNGPNNAVSACRAEWARARTPENATALLEALLPTRRELLERAATRPDATLTREAQALRHEIDGLVVALADTPLAGEGHAAMATLQWETGDLAAARRSYQAACAADFAAGQLALYARHASELSGLLRDTHDYAAARAYLAIGWVAARAAGRRDQQRAIQIARSDITRLSGDLRRAERELQQLLRSAMPAELPELHLKLGTLYVNNEQSGLATVALRDGLAALAAQDDPTSTRDFAEPLHHNLAIAAMQGKRCDEARTHIEAAAALDGEPFEILMSRARIERACGELAAAARLLRAAVVMQLDGEWSWSIPLELGMVEEDLGDLAAAETAYRRAIDAVREIRRLAGDYEPHVIASHREAYERLFGVLATAQRWREVLALLADLDASHMLEAAPSSAPAVVERPVTPLDRSIGAAPGPDTVIAAWRGRPLVAVFPAGARTCRLIVDDGAVTGGCLAGDLDLAAIAARLERHPDDAAAAQQLGAALIPPGPDGQPLALLLVGALSRTPIAALRDPRGLIVGRRPLVRVLGLLDRPRGPWSATAVVLAHVADLAQAEAEARAVARTLGVSPRLGADAGPAGLAAARGAALLHIIAHTDVPITGPVLKLAGGGVAVSTIARLRPAPRLVVLSTCNSATARDEGGWGSLAAGFLAAGAEAVVATSWKVSDAEVPALMDRFYALGGATDPARALGATQADPPAGVSARTWAAFTVIAAPPAAPPAR